MFIWDPDTTKSFEFPPGYNKVSICNLEFVSYSICFYFYFFLVRLKFQLCVSRLYYYKSKYSVLSLQITFLIHFPQKNKSFDCNKRPFSYISDQFIFFFLKFFSLEVLFPPAIVIRNRLALFDSASQKENGGYHL